MKIKCDYCGSYINDTDEHCSNCGSVNAHLVRTADHTPRTIEELKQWYADHHLPPYETTRFFIGIDYKGARAFGIYEEDGKFTVYKNKDDGTRVLRYYGSDEAYAVNELYLKLKSEILNQKSRQSGSVRSTPAKKKSFKEKMTSALTGTGKVIGIFALCIFAYFAFVYKPVLYITLLLMPILVLIAISVIAYKYKSSSFDKMGVIYFIFCILITLILGSIGISKAGTRYYRYDDNIYCYYEYDYYEYDSYYNDYYPISYEALPAQLQNNPVDYEYDASDITWDSNYDITTSDYYYENLQSTSSDSDSSYDWDSGSSWDSGSTDWGSDW